MELVLADPPVDLASMLDSQRELFHRQIEQLQRAVVTQCRLTGVNPLSQEMAAEALSINIGKRPRDLLNPKAIKYMQSVFSVKDSVGKKESREISAMYGITLTQVRDYFAGQRSRVRKSIRLSREKAQKFNETKPSEVTLGVPDEVLGESEHASVSSTDSEQLARAQMDVDNHTSGALNNSNYLGSTDNRINGECNMNLSHEEITPDINMEDKKFLDNIFTLMRREQTFSGQAKLMEWVLQINNSAILYWFLTKGGASILASWLSQSSLEEQTSMILVIFKVLCHLPLQKAPPLQLSSILQTVNKLRFYRTSGRVQPAYLKRLEFVSFLLSKPLSMFDLRFQVFFDNISGYACMPLSFIGNASSMVLFLYGPSFVVIHSISIFHVNVNAQTFNSTMNLQPFHVCDTVSANMKSWIPDAL